MGAQAGAGSASRGSPIPGLCNPMSRNVLNRVESVFRSTFPSVEFSSTLSSEEASDWDSLQQIHFVVALEEEFGVRFDGATVSRMFSIPAVVEAVSARLPQP